MEFEAPIQPEITLKSISLDDVPIVKYDIFYWLVSTAKMSEKESNRYVEKAIAAALLVDDFMIELRRIEKSLRRLYRAGQTWTEDGTEIANLEYEWLGMAQDAIILEDTIRRMKIWRFFPRTRFRLVHRLQYAISAKHRRSLRKCKIVPNEESIQATSPISMIELHRAPVAIPGPFHNRICKFRLSYFKK